jgi:hypothetical protein
MKLSYYNHTFLALTTTVGRLHHEKCDISPSHTGTWSGGTFGMLQSGNIDMIAADLWPTEERLASFHFSTPYSIGEMAIIAPTEAMSSTVEHFLKLSCNRITQ